MNYEARVENCVQTDDKKCVGAPPESLAQMMDEAARVAADVLQMAYRINLHLFGYGEPVNGKEKSAPKCFMDMLQMEMEILNNTREELNKLMDRLGCG